MKTNLIISLLALFLFAPLLHAVTYSSSIVEPNQLAVLANDGGNAIAIIYSANAYGAQAAFVGKTLLVSDGMKLENGDVVQVEFNGTALARISAGAEPDRSGYVTLAVGGETAGLNISQRIYSKLDGYEAIFMPAIPASLAGRRVWFEYSDEFWFVGEMNASSRSVLLYQEAAYGTMDYNRTLSSGQFGLQFVGLEQGTGNAIVRFRAGNLPATLDVYEEMDTEKKLITFWAEYNSTDGAILGADCYASGEIRGALEPIGTRYRGKLDYSYLSGNEFRYSISCSKEGFEPQSRNILLNLTAPPASAPPSVQPPAQDQPPEAPAVPEITGQPYMPAPQPQQPMNIVDWLYQSLANFLRDPLGWMR